MEKSLIVSLLLLVFLVSISAFQMQISLTGFLLLPSLSTPPESVVTIVSQNSTFLVNAAITCTTTGGCNNTNVTLRRNLTIADPDTPISLVFGDTPFYVTAQEVNVSDVSSHVFSIAIGDVDNDTKNEFAFSGGIGNGIEVRYYKNQSGGWTRTDVADFTNDVGSIAVGDVDNDTLNEIVVGVGGGLGGTVNELRYYKNQSGTITEVNVSDYPVEVRSITIGDIDNDGLNEIIVGLDSTTNELRYYNNVSGGWQEVNITNFATRVYKVAVGDADNDGLNELVVGLGGAETNELRYYNNVSGGWQEVLVKSLDSIRAIDIGDIDLDNQNEIIIGLDGIDTELRYYKNQSGGWTEFNISNIAGSFILSVYSIDLADVDNDGEDELVVGGGNLLDIKYYENQSGGWQGTNVTDLPALAYSTVVADVDNNGNNELAVGLEATTNELRYYIIKENPISCGNMTEGQICFANWTLKATGALGSLWAIDVNVSSIGETNNSGDAYIKIGTIPQYTNYQTNVSTAKVGEWVAASATWFDLSTNLSYFIVSTNNTGSWVNETPIAFSQINNSLASRTFLIASGNEGKTVAFQIFANNSINEWNVTSVLGISIQAAPLGVVKQPEQIIVTSQTFDLCVNPGEVLILDVNVDLPVRTITTGIASNVTPICNVTLALKDSDCEQLGFMQNSTIQHQGKSKTIYRCFDIERNLSDAYIVDTQIVFRVPKNWVRDYNVSVPSIELLRYHETVLQPLQTSILESFVPTARVIANITNQTEEFFYFVARTKGLSAFVIVGQGALLGECFIFGFQCIPFLVVMTEIALLVISVHKQRKYMHNRR